MAFERFGRATVKQIAAPPLAALHPVVEHRHVAQGVGAAVVQASAQTHHLGLVQEGGPHVLAVLRADDGVGLHLEVTLTEIIRIIVVDRRSFLSCLNTITRVMGSLVRIG